MMTDKKTIVAQFFEKGKLLTPDALEHIYSGGEVSDAKGILLSFESQADKAKILKNLISKPKEITTDDFIRFYSSKYDKMKDILVSRLQKNFMSLNKLDTARNEVFVLGIVKDVKEREGKKIIELEDLTSSVTVIFDDATQSVELDEVIAVRGVSAGKVLYGKDILYPDIPLRPPTKGRGKACFVSDLHLEQAPKQDIENFFKWFNDSGIGSLFMAGDTGDMRALESFLHEYCSGKKIFIIPGEADSDKEYPQLAEYSSLNSVISLSNPSMVELNGVKILLIHRFTMDMIKKRYLGKSRVILPEDYLVLDEVPDIVHCGYTHEPYVTNYKSVTIVNSGSPLNAFRPVVIDFSTRDVEQARI